jgi:hypothetical protein
VLYLCIACASIKSQNLKREEALEWLLMQKKLLSHNANTKFNLKIAGISNGALGQSTKTRI